MLLTVIILRAIYIISDAYIHMMLCFYLLSKELIWNLNLSWNYNDIITVFNYIK